MGGQTAQQREAFSSLTFMSILALMLVYMVMASQFRSLKDPFIIMFSVPMGLIGVILALFLTRTTLDHVLHGHHHDGGDRRVERRPHRVHERAAPPRLAPGGGRSCRPAGRVSARSS